MENQSKPLEWKGNAYGGQSLHPVVREVQHTVAQIKPVVDSINARLDNAVLKFGSYDGVSFKWDLDSFGPKSNFYQTTVLFGVSSYGQMCHPYLAIDVANDPDHLATGFILTTVTKVAGQKESSRKFIKANELTGALMYFLNSGSFILSALSRMA